MSVQLTTESVQVTAGEVTLAGELVLPAGASAVVAFAHGSGSSRHSPRNRAVAKVLQHARLATLLFDLLTPDEEAEDARTGVHRFDVPLLSRRLTGAVDWLGTGAATGALPVGLFGASTGAAAALTTAADRPEAVKAVVSRGGRPDLAGDALGAVRAPVLLVVGGEDTDVLRLNEEAAAAMDGARHELVVIPGASHLFEEPGTLEQAAVAARGWFELHAAPPATAADADA